MQCDHLVMVEVRVLACRNQATHTTPDLPDGSHTPLCAEHGENTVSFMRLKEFEAKYGPLRKHHLL